MITHLTQIVDIDSIQIGEAITCDFSITSNTQSYSNLGKAESPLLETPINYGQEQTGSFNWICVGKDYQGRTLLMADRCIMNSYPSQDNYLDNIINSSGVIIEIDGREFILKLPSRNMYNRIVVQEEPEISRDLWNWQLPCYTYECPDRNGIFVMGGETADLETSGTYFAGGTGYVRPVLAVIPIEDNPNPGVANGIELVDDISKIQPGKAIACEYAVEGQNTLGSFSNLGKATLDPLPVKQANSANYSGTFYWICIGYDYQGYPKMVADRVIQANIAPDTILDKFPGNAGDMITIDDHEYCKVRCLSSKWDTTINLSDGRYGEYDALLTLYNAYGIKASDKVFHTKYMRTILGQANRSIYSDRIYDMTRVADPDDIYKDKDDSQGILFHSSYIPQAGFRPVLIYAKPEDRSRGRVGTPIDVLNMHKKLHPVGAVPCRYTVTKEGTIGTFSEFGSSTANFINAEGEPLPDGTFYWICVGYTHQGYLKFIADRNIQNNITWDTFDDAYMTRNEGAMTTIDGVDNYRIRLPNSIPNAIVDSTNYGEWDALITLYNEGDIKPSDPIVWNCENTISLTLTVYYDNPNYVVGRGLQGLNENLSAGISQRKIKRSAANDLIGFRPVMFYEVKPPKLFALFEHMDQSVVYKHFNALGN